MIRPRFFGIRLSHEETPIHPIHLDWYMGIPPPKKGFLSKPSSISQYKPSYAIIRVYINLSIGTDHPGLHVWYAQLDLGRRERWQRGWEPSPLAPWRTPRGHVSWCMWFSGLSWFPLSADGWLQAVFHTCEAVTLIHQPYIGDISTIGL